MISKSLRGKRSGQNTEKRFWLPWLKTSDFIESFQYKLEPTPDPTDEEEDSEEEEEEEDDLFGGGGKGADDPAAQAASKMSIHFHVSDQFLYPEAKALAEKQMKEAMAMAQGKCSIS